MAKSSVAYDLEERLSLLQIGFQSVEKFRAHATLFSTSLDYSSHKITGDSPHWGSPRALQSSIGVAPRY